MGNKQDTQIYNALMAYISQMQHQQAPANPALDRITSESMKGADWLQGRDFRDLSKAGAYFDFQAPAEQNAQREKITNAAQGGTFGLANNSGETQATQLQSKYLGDKFARDTAQNFQQNIQGAAGNVQQGLAQSAAGVAGANSLEQNQRLAALSALTSMYGKPKQSSGLLGSLIGAGASIASAF